MMNTRAGRFGPATPQATVHGKLTEAAGSLHDRRGAPRYPTSIGCLLRSDGDEGRAECIDLSATGAAVLARGRAVGLSHLSLVLPGPAGTAEVACEVVRMERVRYGVVLHLRFAALAGDAEDVIKSLLHGSRAEFEAWQRALARVKGQ